MECVVKALRDVKVTGSKPAGTQNPSMLRVGVAQAGCDPRVFWYKDIKNTHTKTLKIHITHIQRH